MADAVCTVTRYRKKTTFDCLVKGGGEHTFVLGETL